MGFHKSTLGDRGANKQLDPSCVSAPPVTNVDLFACFAERLFKITKWLRSRASEPCTSALYVRALNAHAPIVTCCILLPLFLTAAEHGLSLRFGLT